MGDRGIGEDPFDIVLKKGKEIPREHGRHGDDRENDKEPGKVEKVYPREIPEEEAEYRPLGDGGDEGCHRGRRTFINIRRPHVKGDDAELETYAGDKKHRTCAGGQPKVRRKGHAPAHQGKFHGPCRAVDKGHAEEQEGRRRPPKARGT